MKRFLEIQRDTSLKGEWYNVIEFSARLLFVNFSLLERQLNTTELKLISTPSKTPRRTSHESNLLASASLIDDTSLRYND